MRKKLTILIITICFVALLYGRYQYTMSEPSNTKSNKYEVTYTKGEWRSSGPDDYVYYIPVKNIDRSEDVNLRIIFKCVAPIPLYKNPCRGMGCHTISLMYSGIRSYFSVSGKASN